MTDENPGFRYYPLSGAGLELLKQYSASLKDLREEQEALVKEFQDRRLKALEARKVILEAIWRRMAATAGLDPDKTWANSEYQIEDRYLDNGFGAITFVPQNASLAALLGHEGSAVAEEPTDIPAGATIN